MKNPNAARQRILELSQAHAGAITAQMVVDDARDPESPLHDYIEWDAERGLHQYQLTQARQLIRTVRVEVTTIHQTFRPPHFVRDPDLPRETQGYIALPTLQGEAERSRSAVLQEIHRVTQALRRAREVAVVLELEVEIDQFLGQIERFEEQVKAA